MKKTGKSGLEQTAPSRLEDIALYQLSQILNYKTDGSFVDFRRMPFQSTQKTTWMLIMDIRRNAERLTKINSGNTFKIRFRAVYTQAYGDACRRNRTRNTQLPKANTIEFFSWSEKKGGGFVRTLPNPPWLRA